MHAGIQPPPGSKHPPPPPGADTPTADTPPPESSACWDIRATSGWYASYWNAFLFFLLPANVVCEGYVFAGVCLPSPLPGRPPTREIPHPPAKETPLPGRPPHQGDPPAKETPLPGRPPTRETPSSRPTPRGGGKLRGDQVQAHSQG